MTMPSCGGGKQKQFWKTENEEVEAVALASSLEEFSYKKITEKWVNN